MGKFFFALLFVIAGCASQITLFHVHDAKNKEWKESVRSVRRQVGLDFDYYLFVPSEQYDEFDRYFASKKRGKPFLISCASGQLSITFFQLVRSLPKSRTGMLLSTRHVFINTEALKRFAEKGGDGKLFFANFLSHASYERTVPLHDFYFAYKYNSAFPCFTFTLSDLDALTWKDVFRSSILSETSNLPLLDFLFHLKKPILCDHSVLYYDKGASSWHFPVFSTFSVKDSAILPEPVDIVIMTKEGPMAADYQIRALLEKVSCIGKIYVLYEMRGPFEAKGYEKLSGRFPHITPFTPENVLLLDAMLSDTVLLLRGGEIPSEKMDLAAIFLSFVDSGMKAGYIVPQGVVKPAFQWDQGFFTFDTSFVPTGQILKKEGKWGAKLQARRPDGEGFCFILDRFSWREITFPCDLEGRPLYSAEELASLYSEGWTLQVSDTDQMQPAAYPKYDGS
ncbi:MAG: hypothetical protein A3F09_05060 [Chlamydiae bacterium RIFCSPHIGHO2_12_FULL_49_11]|nr:MAG: hypothetical protein A3F09_05060 [Chlamydiae bacterium RIFCSPHIGHO2_12_FULL_49_11]